MAVTTFDSTLAAIEEAVVTLVRAGRSSSLQNRVVADSGLSVDAAAYGVLRALGDEGPLSMTSLARALSVEVSTMSRHVARLERDGFVERARLVGDGRVVVLDLSDRGRAALASLRAARHRLFGELLSTWSAEDREVFAPLLGRLATELRRFGGDS
jgi:DNA-binding MarR family transcriptional regulator